MNESKLSQVLTKLIEKSEEADELSVGELLSVVPHRALGPLLLLPSLLMVSPLSGIPTLPSFCAFLIVAFSSQLLLNRESLWLPDWAKNRTLRAEKVSKALKSMKPWVARIDTVLKPRLEYLVNRRVIGAFAIIVALTVPPLEFLPLAALAPGLVLLGLSLGITGHDGAAVLIASLVFLAFLTGAGYALV